jgi:dTDP-4-dehydrorhamnose reductase
VTQTAPYARRLASGLWLDVRDADSVAELIANARPDAVVNAAYAKGDWAARLVHISSDAVFAYGDPQVYDESCDRRR